MTNKFFFNVIICFFCLLLTVIIFIFSFEPYEKIWLLPATYVLVFILFWRIRIDRQLFRSKGDFLFKTAVTIRYIIIPVLIIVNGNVHYGFGSYVGIEKYDKAILYMAYEMIIVGFIYFLLGRRKKEGISLLHRITQNNNVFLYKILIIVGICFLVIPEIRNRYTFFASKIEMTSRQIVSAYNESYNILFYVTNYAKIAIPIVVLVHYYKKYLKNQKTHYVLLSIFGTILPNLFYIAISRNSIFFPMLASFFTMLAIFRQHKKLIFSIYGTGIISVIGVMTWLKSFLQSPNMSLDWVTNYLSIYFLGPKEYAIGLSSIETYSTDTTFYTFINDLIGNIPGLSGFANLFDRTSQYYNWEYYGGALMEAGGGYIVPSSIQGAFHFGYLIGPILVIIALFTIRWSDGVTNNKKFINISTIYIANYTMSYAALFYANSVSSLLNLLFFIIIPMLSINLVQRLFCLKTTHC